MSVWFPIKALTFNVFHDYPSCRHIDRRLDLLTEGLVSEAPDVVMLQEISVSKLYGDLSLRLAEALAARGLRYHRVYSPANGSVAEGGTFEEGSAVLSRWPIVDSAVRGLSSSRPVWREAHGYRYEEFRIAVRATVEIELGLWLDVFGAHLTDAREDPQAKPCQIAELAAFVAERSHESLSVVGGDFNARPDAAEIAHLRGAGFRDACAEHEPGPTNDSRDRDLESPTDTANQRIDYLFVAGRGAAEARVRATRLFLASAVEIEPGRHLWASDHSGIVAELDLPLRYFLPPSSS